MRIFIGTGEVAGQIPLFAEGFRALGHEVTTGVLAGHAYAFDSNLHYDVAIHRNNPTQIKNIIAEHDVFLFQFGQSLLPENQDFASIKHAGKKIISLFNGSDVRYFPAYEHTHGINYSEITQEAIHEAWGKKFIARVIPPLRRAEIYADIIVSHPSHMQLAIRPYLHFFALLDVKGKIFHIPERHVPHIVHAPSHKGVKCTNLFLAALEELKQEGVAFELQLLHGVQNSEVFSALADADCVIDQLILSHGLFTVEAMASGCAVAVGHYPHAEPFSTRIPIHPLHPSTFKEDLRAFLTNREMRIRLAREGRAHALKYHTPEFLCRNILQALDEGEQHTCDYHPCHYAKKFILPEGVHIPKEYLKMGDEVALRWGLPEDAEPADMVRRGLLSPDILRKAVPRRGETPDDCARWLGKPFKPTTWAETPHPAAEVPDLLRNLKRFSLLRLFPKSAFLGQLPLKLNVALGCGHIQEAVTLLAQTIQQNPDTNGDTLAALALLLWGRGERRQALRVFPAALSEPALPLLRWLTALDLLERGLNARAMPMILDVLSGMPEAVHGAAFFGNEQTYSPDISCIIRAGKPTNVTTAWYSPACLTPDWCSMEQEKSAHPVRLYLCLAQGYGIEIADDASASTGILNELLRTRSRCRQTAL